MQYLILDKYQFSAILKYLCVVPHHWQCIGCPKINCDFLKAPFSASCENRYVRSVGMFLKHPAAKKSTYFRPKSVYLAIWPLFFSTSFWKKISWELVIKKIEMEKYLWGWKCLHVRLQHCVANWRVPAVPQSYFWTHHIKFCFDIQFNLRTRTKT